MILATLRPLHQAGYLHLDVSDSNLINTRMGNEDNPVLALIDFNSAYHMDALRGAEDTRPVISRKLGFSAPELADEWLDCSVIDTHTDLYFVAAILFLSLHRRFLTHMEQGDDRLLCLPKDSPMAKTSRPKIVDMCNDILQKGLANDPAKRYQSVDKFETDIDAVLAEANNKVYLQAGLPEPSEKFVDSSRINELKELGENLDKLPYVDLIGEEGIGRKELTKKYALDSKYDGLFVANYRIKENLNSLLEKLPFANDTPPEKGAAIYHYNLLDNAAKRILLVIDEYDRNIVENNIASPKSKEQEQKWRSELCRLTKTKVVFLSNSSLADIFPNAYENSMVLKGLDRDCALSLFYKHCSQAEQYGPKIIMILEHDKINYNTARIINIAERLKWEETLSEDAIGLYYSSLGAAHTDSLPKDTTFQADAQDLSKVNAIVWRTSKHINKKGGKTSQLPMDFTYDPVSLTADSINFVAVGGGSTDNPTDYTSNAFAYTWTDDLESDYQDLRRGLIWFVQGSQDPVTGPQFTINERILELYKVAACKDERVVKKIEDMKLKPGTTYRAFVYRLGDAQFAPTLARPVVNANDPRFMPGTFTTKPATVANGIPQSVIYPYINEKWSDPAKDNYRPSSALIYATGGNGLGKYYFLISNRSLTTLPPKGTVGSLYTDLNSEGSNGKWIAANLEKEFGNSLYIPEGTLNPNTTYHVWAYRAGDELYRDSPIYPLRSSSKLGVNTHSFTTAPKKPQ
jgi:serine/threonine protein kinase